MKGASAIVTGATRGLGEALAHVLIESDMMVVGVSRRQPTSGRWARILESGQGTHVLGDVAADGTAQRAVEAATRNHVLRLLINCAGIGVFRDAGAYRFDEVQRVLSSNLIGTILFCEACIPYLKEAGGTIMNIMSTAALVARPSESVYCAAKWGARGYTETIRQELRPAGVKVIGVFPGGMNTTFWKNSGASPDASKFMSVDEVASAILTQRGLGSTGYVSDITINRI